ncbi:hypothetical protein TrST_g13158 [Triparma strigata]|uniref:Uncharacterized protein n=1 Tax=Triparma strigata TaxID=1606541 RepID=A0A9W7BAB1_9STRA|nr:hypothetical protein TrST_g13158 [Triparma strigata]
MKASSSNEPSSHVIDPLKDPTITDMMAFLTFLSTSYRSSSHLSKLSPPADELPKQWVITWRALSTFFTILCVYMISQNISAWISFETTLVPTFHNSRAALQFPDVTVCNLNTLVDDDRLPDNLTKFCNTSDLSWNMTVNTLNEIVDSDLIAYGARLDELVFGCEVAGEDCQPTDWKQVVPYGAGWGVCYTLSGERFGKPEGIGIFNSIELRMFLDSEKYCASISSGEGVRVTVHERGSFPDPNTGVTLGPAQTHHLGVKAQKVVKQSGYFFPECEKKEKPFYQAAEPCWDKCVVEVTLNKCGCKVEGSQKYDQYILPWCEDDEELDLCQDQVEDLWMADEDECDCPLDRCEKTSYEIFKGSAKWPSEKRRKLDWGGEDPSEYVQARIYFQDFGYTEYKETPTTTFVAMLSAIGGSMGLCLGMSLISLTEFLELVGVLLSRVFRRRQDVRRRRREEEEEDKRKRLLSDGSANLAGGGGREMKAAC